MNTPSTPPPPKTPTEELLYNMKVTAGCRFNAHKRLENREKGLTRLTAFTSGYLASLTVLPYVLKLPVEVADRLNLLTIVCGGIVLISSLLQYSSRDSVNAEEFHRCALEVNELRRKMKAAGANLPLRRLDTFTDRYNAILQKFSINHDDLDYQKYQLERPEEFPWLNWRTRCAFGWKQWKARTATNAVLVVISAAFAWIVVIYAFPNSQFGRPAQMVPAQHAVENLTIGR